MANALYVLALMASLAVLVNAAVTSSSYCNIESCNYFSQNKPHTFCTFKENVVSNNCGKVTSTKLTQAEQNSLVELHNKYRTKVYSGKETRGKYGPQPPADKIKLLKWNPELARIAQTWANQCVFEHDKCRDTPKFQVGQNIGYEGSTGSFPDFTPIVDAWYDEVKDFEPRIVTRYLASKERPANAPVIGHYTQMVWADTTDIGCGLIRYNNDRKFNKSYLVCNYGPAGNMIGDPVYKIR